MTEEGSGIEPTPAAQKEVLEDTSLSEIPEFLHPYIFIPFNEDANIQEGDWVVDPYILKKDGMPMIAIYKSLDDGSPLFQVKVEKIGNTELRTVSKLEHISPTKINKSILCKFVKDKVGTWSILPSDQNPSDLQL